MSNVVLPDRYKNCVVLETRPLLLHIETPEGNTFWIRREEPAPAPQPAIVAAGKRSAKGKVKRSGG